MSDGLQVTGLVQVAFSVRDLDKATRFYRDVLGLTYLFSAPPSLVFLQCGQTRLMLSAHTDAQPESHPILYYSVPDIHAAFAGLANKGAPITQVPQMIAKLGTNDLWLGFTEDPDGHPVGLMSEVPVALA
jgi:methylmalonyl-CoA/ethylmalonyl-CoA epimerase